jgi:asparagine synthase (glutamine-hydrolysing)
MYHKFGDVASFINELDGVFAFVLHDEEKGITFVGRDPIGVRPVFQGQDYSGNYLFASEAKTILGICDPTTIKPFPPGHMWDSKKKVAKKWYNPTFNLEETNLETFDEKSALTKTATLLYEASKKRMMSDRPIGTFLSGGLDSSVIAAFIKKYHNENGMKTNLNTYSVGMEGSPDLFYANIVAKHIGSTHHNVEIKFEDCLEILEDVIYATETFDVTSIRASTPMYLLSKYIKENTDDIVIYSGEGSDEISQGYLYFKNQPSPREGALESKKLVEELY